MLKKDRVGEKTKNTYGTTMEIIEYKDANNMVVRFEDGYIVKSRYKEFKNGNIKNPYDKSVFGIGFIGEGLYKVSENAKSTRVYETWNGIMSRCYSKTSHVKNPSYKGCTVAEEWNNFQNFAKWYDENYYEVEGYETHLDKDILKKGNKIYSSETCVFIPENINSLFTARKSKRNVCIGVILSKNGEKFISTCGDGLGNRIYLGTFDTKERAFEAYKKQKEQVINEVANKFKELIPEKVYKAMINYKVDIND